MERADEPPPPADLLYRIGWYVSVYARDSEVYVKRSGWVGKEDVRARDEAEREARARDGRSHEIKNQVSTIS